MKSFQTACAIALLLTTVHTPVVAGIVIDFDDRPVGRTAGSTYSSLGVTFASGDIPDDVNVGDIITFSNRTDFFEILDTSPRSLPNFAAADGLGLRDTLFLFDTPATSVMLDLDARFNEPAADIVRLLGLRTTTLSNTFEIVAIAETLDTSSEPLTVTWSTTPFHAAIFQVTTELEGFDNLRVTSVPEPSSAVFVITVSGVAFVVRRGRRLVS